MSVEELTDKERSLLVYCLEKHKPNLLTQLPVLDSGTPDADLVNEMREAVGSEIAAKGFLGDDKKSYEYGMELEALIDKLADLYLWPDLKTKLRQNKKKSRSNFSKRFLSVFKKVLKRAKPS